MAATHRERASAHADRVRDRLRPSSAARRDAVSRALGRARFAPAETEYVSKNDADDGANLTPESERHLDEITGRFAAVVAEAIRQSAHDDERDETDRAASTVPPSTPPVLHRAQRSTAAIAKMVGSLAAAVTGVIALLHALGWL